MTSDPRKILVADAIPASNKVCLASSKMFLNVNFRELTSRIILFGDVLQDIRVATTH